MSDTLKDGFYNFKAGETLPDWCSFSPGAKIERGGVNCHVNNGTVEEWKISENTQLEGGYYLYSNGKKVSKIHIKQKRKITKELKPEGRSINKRIALYIFYFLAFLILATTFAFNVFR